MASLGSWMKMMLRKMQKRCGKDAAEEDDVVVELPPEVVALIQARLPLASLLRSRAVCRAWNEAVASPARLLKERLESRGGERDRLLCVVGRCDSDPVCCVYDRASDRWYKLQLPTYLRRAQVPLCKRRRRPSGEIVVFADGVLCAGFSKGSEAGGGVLVSLVYKLVSGENVVVPHLGNPVASSWTWMPALPGRLLLGQVMGVLVDAGKRCFKAVAVEEKSRGNRAGVPPSRLTYVFDSEIGRWSVRVTRPVAPEFICIMGGQGVFMGTVLYCVGSSMRNLFAYNLETGTWRFLQVARPPGFTTCMYDTKLVRVRERLLCVAQDGAPEVGHRSEGYSTVHILELDFARMTWTGVDVMPDSMATEFWEPCLSRDTGRVEWEFGNLITVVAGQDSELYIMHDMVGKILAVDLRHRPAVWRWLPSYPYKKVVSNISFHCVDPWLELGKWRQL